MTNMTVIYITKYNDSRNTITLDCYID